MALDKEYITSERFIHDVLRERAGWVVRKLYRLWSRNGRIGPVALSWPAEKLKLSNGQEYDKVVTCPLPTEEKDRPARLRLLIERTNPYALLLVEQRKDSVKALFESRHGARCWTLPLKDHGGVKILGDMSHEDDGECIGLLWRKGQALN